MMSNFFLPLVGVLIGGLGALTGAGGGIVAVPFLLFWGLSKETAAGTSFVNMIMLVVASLFLYGSRGVIDWKTGLLLGAGSMVGAYLAVTYLQPRIDMVTFQYAFAVFLILIAVSMIVGIRP